MNKWLFLILFIFLSLFPAQAQVPKVLRTAKISWTKEFLNSLNQYLQSTLIQTLCAQPYKLLIDTQSPLNAKEAQQLSESLLKEASMQTPLLIQAPSIEPLEQNIHRFVFTVSPLNEPDHIVGTGFVFAQDAPGEKTLLWGATTADVARKTGPEVQVTFHTRTPHDFSFPAHIVRQGNPAGINAALIKLPAKSSVVALPIKLSTHPFPSGEQPLMAYGFDQNGSFYKKGLALIFTGAERLIAQSPRPISAETGNGGLVVNQQGQALGIYNDTFRPEQEETQFPSRVSRQAQRATYLSEFSPVTHLAHLLRDYQLAGSAARVILFDGIQVGKIQIKEAISQVKIFYKHQAPVVLSPNPFWELTTLHEFVPDLHDATRVEIYISDGEKSSYYYLLDLKNRIAVKRPTVSSRSDSF